MPAHDTLQAATPPPDPPDGVARRAGRPAGAPLLLGRTQYAGAFLMLGEPLEWLDAARECFADHYGTLTRGLLTSAIAPIVGLERIWHLDEMEDLGFALLTGGYRCPSRYTVGGWRCHLRWYEVDAFCRRTAPWHLVRGDDAIVSFDEHTIPRWTKKFRIPKGYVTTRNKYMRCEKLFCSYSINAGRFLAVRATPGNWGLHDMAVPLVRQVLDCGDPRTCCLVRRRRRQVGRRCAGLLDLAKDKTRLDIILRACRYPHRLQQWKQLPSGLFISVTEPGVCFDAPPKEIRLAETKTVLKGETEDQAVRTIVCREIAPGPKKDRWHPLFTTSAGFTRKSCSSSARGRTRSRRSASRCMTLS